MTALAPEAVSAKQQNKSNGLSKDKGKAKEAESDGPATKEETAIGKVVRDTKKITVECNHGLM